MKRFVSFFLSAAFLLAMSAPLTAQKFFTRDASVNFDATAKGSPETIEAKHSSGTVILNQATGAVEAQVLIRGFLFERALMQEHFNENYMESGKFPKATFKGKLSATDASKLATDGTYTLKIAGKMTMHGVTKDMSTSAVFTVKGANITAKTTFDLTLEDYGINIPSVVSDKVAKAARIEIDAALAPLRK